MNLHDDRGPGILATCIFALVFDILCVSLRILSRILNKSDFWWDDWTAIAALPFCLGMSSTVIWWTSVGLGKHQAVVPNPLSDSLIATFILQLFYIYGLLFVKLSALLFYARIFKIVRWFRITLWIAAAMVLAWDLGVTFQSIFACVPVQAFWYPEKYPDARCAKKYSEYLGNGIPNAFTDLVIVLIPLPMVFRIHATIRRRLTVAAIFLFSYGVVAVSIARTTVIAYDGPLYAFDYTWYPSRMMILCVLEPGLGLICICLPPILKLIEYFHDRAAKARSKRSPSSGQHMTELSINSKQALSTSKLVRERASQ